MTHKSLQQQIAHHSKKDQSLKEVKENIHAQQIVLIKALNAHPDIKALAKLASNQAKYDIEYYKVRKRLIKEDDDINLIFADLLELQERYAYELKKIKSIAALMNRLKAIEKKQLEMK